MTLVAATTIEVVAGRPTVTKRRIGPEASARTEAEGRWLAAARHQGVVRLRSVMVDDGRLATDLAGLHTVRTWHHDGPAASVVLSRVAATLADLHRRGLVHGNLTPDHIVLAGPDLTEPILCSPIGGKDPELDLTALSDLVASAAERQRGRSKRRWLHTLDRLTDPDRPIRATQAATLLEHTEI